jgi:hypothetical protein
VDVIGKTLKKLESAGYMEAASFAAQITDANLTHLKAALYEASKDPLR